VTTGGLRGFCRWDRDRLLDLYRARFGVPPSVPLLPARVLDEILVEILGYKLTEKQLPPGQVAVINFDLRCITTTLHIVGVRPNTNVKALLTATKAHELGHVRLGHEEELRRETVCWARDVLGQDAKFRLLGEPEGEASWGYQRREMEADLYAGVFLVPQDELEERQVMKRLRRAQEQGRQLAVKTLWDYTYELAASFEVSPAMMRRHLVELGVVEYFPEAQELRLRHLFPGPPASCEASFRSPAVSQAASRWGSSSSGHTTSTSVSR
jgi:hypothetical protein